MKKNTVLSSVAVAGLALALTACGSDVNETSETGPPPAPSSPSTPSATPETSSQSEILSPAEAISLAEQQNGGTAYTIERSDDRSGWDVDVLEGDTGHEYEIGDDGTVVRDDSDDPDDNDRRITDSSFISITEAIDAVLSQHPDLVLDSAEFSEDDGWFHFEIELDDADGNDRGEFVVDATSAEVKAD